MTVYKVYSNKYLIYQIKTDWLITVYKVLTNTEQQALSALHFRTM